MFKSLIVLICVAAGAAAGYSLMLAYPGNYTSKASLKIGTPLMPARYVPGIPGISQDQLKSIAQAALSRAALTIIIQTLDLYPEMRTKQPMEDVIERMRKEVKVDIKEDTVDIAFAYADRYKVQRTVSELASRMIDQSRRETSMSAQGTIQLLFEMSQKAATELRSASERAAGSRDEVLLLNRDLARKHYQDLQMKLMETGEVDEAVRRGFGSYLEVTHAASLPVAPDGDHKWYPALGAIGGAAFAIITLAAVRVRARHRPRELEEAHAEV